MTVASRSLAACTVAALAAACGAWIFNREIEGAFWVFFIPGSVMLLPFMVVTGGVHGPLMAAYSWLLVSVNAVLYGCLTGIALSLRLIRFRGHLPKGGYDVQTDARHPEEDPAAAPAV